MSATGLPAHAAPYAAPIGNLISDPVDTPSSPLDIVTATRSDDPGTPVTFVITTNTTFTDQQALFVIRMDTDSDNIDDHRLVFGWDGFAMSGDLDHGTPHAVLITDVSRPNQKSIKVTFSPTLINNSSGLGWEVASIYKPSPGTVISDAAPDSEGFLAHPPTQRVAGADRIETAIESSFFSPTLAQAVVVARSDSYADALAGAPLAAVKKAPMLLNPTGALDARVKAEIKRALPAGNKVYLLGGFSALSLAVENAIKAEGYVVVRYQGIDRFETSIKIANALGDPPTLFLTTGTNFADALPAGPAAAAKHGAVLLTDGSALSPNVSAYIAAHPGAQRFAIGGPAAAADPGATAVVGNDRYDTAKKVAETFFTNPSELGLASGTNFADALGGGTAIAERNPAGPLLLTDPGALSGPTHDYLVANKANVVTVYVFGGLTAVSKPVEDAVNSALA